MTIKRYLLLLIILLLFPVTVNANVKDVNRLISESWNGNYATTESVSPYKSKRIVTHKKLKGYGETDWATCEFMTVMRFESEEDTEKAFKKIIKEDPTAYVDEIIYSKEGRNIGEFASDNNMGMVYAGMYDYGKKKVTVAVLDSGLTPKSIMFKGRKISKYSRNVIDNSKNYSDGNGHGTSIASVIADVTPKNVEFMPIKVLDNEGNGTAASIALGLYYAIQNNADVINMSYGAYEGTAEQDDLLKLAYKKRILMFASSGNRGDNYMKYPAASPYTISVGSFCSMDKKRSKFSNYGSGLDFVAPGELVTALDKNNEIMIYAGTSYSTAYMSAAGCYLKLVDKKINMKKAYKLFKSGARDFGKKGKDQYYGWGCPKVGWSVNQLFKQRLKKEKIKGILKRNFYKKRNSIYRKRDKKLFVKRKI